MTKNRVVITGLGVLSPLGNDVTTFWQNLLAGKSGAGSITQFDTSGFPVRFGAEVKNFDPARWFEEREVRRMDRFSQFALAAGIQAVEDAKMDWEKVDRSRCGVILGSGIGGLSEIQEQHKRYLEKGPDRLSPFFIPRMMVNAAAGLLAIRFRLGGTNFTTASACATGNHAMGTALRTLQYGDADLILTGGSEAALTYLALNGFASMGALSRRNDAPEKASRPFDKNRDGFVLGEGAGILVFEELGFALNRGARIYAEVLGFGNSNDAYHLTQPDPEGTGGALAMSRALADAGIRPEQVSYINAHGTSTPLNDKIETNAIKQVFGPHAKRIPISSTKSMIGHLLGAAAAVEMIATVLSIQQGILHPTINFETPDPECDLDYIPNTKRQGNVEVALSNALGFGGHNSVLIVGRYRG